MADIKSDLKKMVPHLLKAREENLNEADTVLRVIKVFEDVLGYDGLSEITSEAKIKDKYVDLAIKIDGTIKLLVEVKAAAIPLREKHIDQAESYAAHANIPWVLLTNGVEWNLYHLTFDEGIEHAVAFAADLGDEEVNLDAAGEKLKYLSRQSLKKGDLDDFWKEKMALSPESIAQALFCESSLKFLRRELRRKTGLLTELEDLGAALHNMFTVEARERIGPMRISYRRGRSIVRRSKSEDERPESGEAATAPDAS